MKNWIVSFEIDGEMLVNKDVPQAICCFLWREPDAKRFKLRERKGIDPDSTFSSVYWYNNCWLNEIKDYGYASITLEFIGWFLFETQCLRKLPESRHSVKQHWFFIHIWFRYFLQCHWMGNITHNRVEHDCCISFTITGGLEWIKCDISQFCNAVNSCVWFGTIPSLCWSHSKRGHETGHQ